MTIPPTSALVKTNFIEAGNPRARRGALCSHTTCMPVVKIFPRLEFGKIVYSVTTCQHFITA
jgi:hypothetical protein